MVIRYECPVENIKSGGRELVSFNPDFSLTAQVMSLE